MVPLQMAILAIALGLVAAAKDLFRVATQAIASALGPADRGVRRQPRAPLIDLGIYPGSRCQALVWPNLALSLAGFLSAADAQESDRIFPILQLTDRAVAEIDVTDGSVDDWQYIQPILLGV